MDEEADSRFDEERVYLQWLKLRRPLPVRLGGWYPVSIWISAFILPFVTVVIILLDFFYFIPRCIHDDFNDPMGRDILYTPVSTDDVIRDLHAWGSSLATNHAVPLIIFYCLIALFALLGAGEQFVVVMIPLTAFIYLHYRFLLELAIIAAALPRWVTTTGLPVIGIYLPLNILAALFIMWFYGQEWQPVIANTVGPILMAAALILLMQFMATRLAPRLMEMRRQGRWE